MVQIHLLKEIRKKIMAKEMEEINLNKSINSGHKCGSKINSFKDLYIPLLLLFILLSNISDCYSSFCLFASNIEIITLKIK